MKKEKRDLNKILIDVQSEEMVQDLAEMDYKKYLQSNYWGLVRKTMHDEIGYKCEICGSDKFINVHHFNYDNRGKETLNDLACLCPLCHEAMHNYESPFIGHIIERKQFEKQIKIANKIKKDFTNKKFLKILPLTQNGSWEIKQLELLFECEAEKIRDMYTEELKNKLVVKSLGICGGNTFELYILNKFIWYIIKLDFPKVGD